MSGRAAPDVVKALMYRPEYWGTPYNALLHDAMRGPSRWPIAERELMATYVSNLNQCVF